MFLTEAEAKRRLEHSRNILSPNYVQEIEAESESVSEPESSEQEQESDDSSQDQLATPVLSDIDKLLAGAVDPQRIRGRTGTLRGQVDAQVAVGTTALILGAGKTGPMFGLSEQQSYAYREGLSTTSDLADRKDRVPERSRRIRTVKEQLAEVASNKLRAALTSLTDSKINECNGPRISSIAKDMAVVLDKVTKDHEKAESIHFHIFRPEMRTVSDYTTVPVGSGAVIEAVTVTKKGGGAD